MYLAPGFIDIQVNGFAGVDYNSPVATHEEIARSIDAVFSTGVTRFFPTVITGAPDKMLAALKNLAGARETLEHGNAMEAFHVEGPHISPDDGPRGAHPRRWVRAPDLDEFRRMQDAARRQYSTGDAGSRMARVRSNISSGSRREGVVVSIGHTAATPAQIRDAVDAGATLSTHLGNAGHATLTEISELSVDAARRRSAGCQLHRRRHPSRPRLFPRRAAFERNRAVDSDHRRRNARAVPARILRSGRNAGGAARKMAEWCCAAERVWLDRACAWIAPLKTSMRTGGVSLTEAITMATVNPARVARIRSRQRSLSPGERADLVQIQLCGWTRED